MSESDPSRTLEGLSKLSGFQLFDGPCRYLTGDGGSFLWSMSGVQLHRRHRMGKLPVFLQSAAINTLPPHKESQKTLFIGEGAEAWKTGTQSGGCFWSGDFCSV